MYGRRAASAVFALEFVATLVHIRGSPAITRHNQIGDDLMTHLICRSLILIAALAGIAESAYGQICVTSDGASDTACGTNQPTSDVRDIGQRDGDRKQRRHCG